MNILTIKIKIKNGMNIKITPRIFLKIFDNIRIQLFIFMCRNALIIVHINIDMNTSTTNDKFNFS